MVDEIRLEIPNDREKERTGSGEISSGSGEVERAYAAADPLNWEGSYAIALALQAAHPDVRLEDVSLGMIYRWTIELPQFEDDPELANEGILTSIYQEWFEEVNPV